MLSDLIAQLERGKFTPAQIALHIRVACALGAEWELEDYSDDPDNPSVAFQLLTRAQTGRVVVQFRDIREEGESKSG